MRRNPLYVFKNQDATGIYDVPLKSMVHIIDSNGAGTPKFVQLVAKTGLGPASTIHQFLMDPTLYIDAQPNIDFSEYLKVDGSTQMAVAYQPSTDQDVTTKYYVDHEIQNYVLPSELEKITEGGNIGWRLLGRNPDNYGNIGEEAIDLSFSNSASTTRGATGRASVAEGYLTTASGDYAHAEGYNTTASQYTSHAEGSTTEASGYASHAQGYNSKATGDMSDASGERTIASGRASHAEGEWTEAIGDNSHAGGLHTTAKGKNSVANGYKCYSAANNSSSMGITSVTARWGGRYDSIDFTNKTVQLTHDNYFALNPSVGDKVLIYTMLTDDWTPDDVIYNEQTITAVDSANYTVTLDDIQGTYIAGDQKVIINISKSESDFYTTGRAEGFGCLNASWSGLAEGVVTTVTKGGHAEGQYTVSSGRFAHAEGEYTTAHNDCMHAEGRFNIGTSPTTIHETGIGTGESNRKNAFEIHTDGRLIAPELTTALITDARSLVTKEYADALGGGGVSATGLEKITENGNTGWRLVGRDPDNYGDIGNEAVDLSYSWTSGTTNGATGDYSVAFGIENRSQGSCSFAMGIGNYATAPYSTAIGVALSATGYASFASGLSTYASGEGSHCIGASTEASGDYSHAEGHETKAQNDYMHAAGKWNVGTATDTIHETGIGVNDSNRANAFEIYTDGRIHAPELTTALITDARCLVTKEYADASGGASELEKITEGGHTGWRILGRDPANYGDIGEGAIDFSYRNSAGTTYGAVGGYTFAEGYSTIADNWYSHAEGSNTSALGYASHTEGYYSTAGGLTSHAEGFRSNAAGAYSHAEGYHTTAQNSAHAEGYYTTASGNHSHSEGYKTTASGKHSHSEGFQNTASGNYGSHAEGSNTTASGYNSHTEGRNTIASGSPSHAEGGWSQANGAYSHAEGHETRANNDAMHAAGKFNIGAATDTIHETGIGVNDSNRANAFEIYTDGRIHAPELTTALITDARCLVTKEYADALGGGGVSATGLEKITEGSNTGWRLIGRDPANYGSIGSNAVDLSNSTSASSVRGATGADSFAVGKNSQASGWGSVALGSYNTVSGDFASATGISNLVSQRAAHAEGENNKATQRYCHVEGFENEAQGYNSHAEGRGTISSGQYSHSEGLGTLAANNSMHAAGKYNVGTSTDTIHETGIGTSSSNKLNAFEIYTDGRIHAPELTTALITDARCLVTKEYADALGGGGVSAIDDLTDVDTSTIIPTNGQILKWNDTVSVWEPADDIDTDTTYTNGTGLSLTGTVFALDAAIDNLTDVDTTTNSPVADDYLKWDGTNWVPAAPQTIAIDDLSDVDTTTSSPTVGQTLTWDGTNWIPSNIEKSGTTANRPATPYTGMMYFDTDLTKPIWYSGTGWVDATGTSV